MISSERYESISNEFKGKRIFILGDLMLDRYYYGQSSRMSPEAPVPVVDIQKIKSQDKSWKDEILMVWLIAMLSTGWFDETRDNFEEWVRIINDLPDSVWYLVIIVFTATFSTKMTDKVLNRNKKK